MPADAAGARLFLGQDMQSVSYEPFAGGTAAILSVRSPAKQTANEDGALLVSCDGGGVLAVADGVGGHQAGAEATKATLTILSRTLAAARNAGTPLRGAILDAFEKANQTVCALGVGAGTTLVVAEIQDGAVRSYHAGDSALLVVGQRGRIKHQTTSHSPVGYAVESGLLDEDVAMVHEDRHIVSNVIGTPDMHIEVGPRLALAARDTLVVASDGLFDNLALDVIVGRVRKGPLPAAAKGLWQGSRQCMQEQREGRPGKPDDLTFVLWRQDARVHGT